MSSPAFPLSPHLDPPNDTPSMGSVWDEVHHVPQVTVLAACEMKADHRTSLESLSRILPYFWNAVVTALPESLGCDTIATEQSGS